VLADRPVARSEGLVSEELDGQLLLYDTESHLAHALEGEATAVWRACDGHADVEALARRCATGEEDVRATLVRLDELGLLEQVGETRRSALVKLTAAGVGLSAGIPTITSILVPTAAQAVTGQVCTTEVVTQSDLNVDGTHWYFYNDTTDTASTAEDAAHYKFVTGPGSPPAGSGSVFFHDDAPNTNQRWDINTSRYAGTQLSDLTALKFNTYQPTGDAPGQAIYLNFDVDFGDSLVPPYQGRLFYVPSQNGTVLLDTWQAWDALSAGALWGWSRFANNGNQWPDGDVTPLRTWADIVASFPNAAINGGVPGQLVFRAGEPYPAGFTGYLDKVTVGVGAACTTFDFEPSTA
jgi:hypothetical protein